MPWAMSVIMIDNIASCRVDYRFNGAVVVAWLLGPVGRCEAHHRLSLLAPCGKAAAERFRGEAAISDSSRMELERQ